MLLIEKWKGFNVKDWCVENLRSWLRCYDEMMDEKPKICNRVPIKNRLKKLIKLLK